MREKQTQQSRTNEERTADALLVFKSLTENKNYGRSKRCKGAE